MKTLINCICVLGKSLKSWSKKWDESLNKDLPEYQTTKEGWCALLDAGSKQANIHIDMSKSLINYPVLKIKDWIKRNYAKSILSYKQTKEFEENFEDAQKSWVELNDRSRKARKEYVEAIKSARSANEASESAESNPQHTVESRAKLQHKAQHAVDEQAR